MFKKILAVAAALTLSTGVMAGTTSFNSGSEFSSTQGAGGWTYGYYTAAGDASTFTQFAYFDATTNPQWWEESQTQAPWTLMWDTGAHPDSTSGDHWAVRRWTSTVDGVLNLGAQYQLENPLGTTKVHVLVNGGEVFVADAQATLETTSWMGSIANGSTVDFAIDPVGAQAYDATRLTAQGYVTAVSAVPEPESYALMLAGLGLVSAVARRRARKA